jgi:GMP synthase C terminal domain
MSIGGMTVGWVRISWDVLEKISVRIVNEVENVNRIVYDVTSKPPATIECIKYSLLFALFSFISLYPSIINTFFMLW